MLATNAAKCRSRLEYLHLITDYANIHTLYLAPDANTTVKSVRKSAIRYCSITPYYIAKNDEL